MKRQTTLITAGAAMRLLGAVALPLLPRGPKKKPRKTPKPERKGAVWKGKSETDLFYLDRAKAKRERKAAKRVTHGH
jgi:hypothetical protein